MSIQRDLSTTEAARMMGISGAMVRKLVDDGRLPGYKIPGSRFRRIRQADLLVFMLQHGIPIPMDMRGQA